MNHSLKSLPGILFGVLAFVALAHHTAVAEETNAHDFVFTSIEGERLALSQFEGKALLIVNTASFCGFTYQYDGLQKAWERYRDRGLVVLGVPSNDFGNQEPGSEADIKKFCEVRYIDFPLTAKVRVRGKEAHPFYKWAARTLGAGAAPRWNFHKYLVSPDGRLVSHFPSATEPGSKKVVEAIEALIQ